MFLFHSLYMQKVESTRVVLFYGQVGSYKTLSAIATARLLLQSGRYARVYSNTPVTFATSPPEVEKFDFNAEYSRNSIFIIDESGIFLSGKHEEVKEIFAFPRHKNQVFLLASKIETKQVRNYADLFVTRDFNYSMFGLPIMSFRSGSWSEPSKKQPKHWIMMYSRYFRFYASRYDPVSIYPIKQYRDSGTLYDKYSRQVPKQISKFFVINSWGLAEKKSKLTQGQEYLVKQYLPEFDVEALFHDEETIPKVKRRWNFNPIGTEFSIKIFIQLALTVYLFLCVANYVGQTNGKQIGLLEWELSDYKEFVTLGTIRKIKDDDSIETVDNKEKEVIEWTIE